VLTIYFYSYSFMMLLLLMNMLIAILMDGYTSAKSFAESAVEEALRFNVGPLLPEVKMQLKAFVSAPFISLKHPSLSLEEKSSLVNDGRWTDVRWMRLMETVIARLKERHESPRGVTMGSLIRHLCAITNMPRKLVIEQVYRKFEERVFKWPTDPNRPFEEPTTDSYVKDLAQMVKSQEYRSRELLKMAVDTMGVLDEMRGAMISRGLMQQPDAARPLVRHSSTVHVGRARKGSAKTSSLPAAAPARAGGGQAVPPVPESDRCSWPTLST